MNKFKCAILGIILSIAPWTVWADAVDINTATADQIAAGLKGVGKSKAEAIVKDREKNGPFKSVDDLARVKGVKAGIITKNRDNITVTAPGLAVPAIPRPAASVPAVAPAVPAVPAPVVK
ncbi:ComEA family DNA-binding protein [Candidatus Methylospira mobilis]|uniref:ComEA family DNA-binding protein n=1 Tax=Candidatus Methylospira mobilis TaxID=1808979 RepID=A0A5Q0BGZ4_9GAMM|nr:ComEA family DNA-binding protein [Candidatus Methylospira mobilis]QFY42809.1 ComEA family DNA-binding protein [Candidatus Methylospira mobilis]WNV03701.1 ComEA family DNA-binding protein [Candidatus Methylospira mobilis]